MEINSDVFGMWYHNSHIYYIRWNENACIWQGRKEDQTFFMIICSVLCWMLSLSSIQCVSNLNSSNHIDLASYCLIYNEIKYFNW